MYRCYNHYKRRNKNRTCVQSVQLFSFLFNSVNEDVSTFVFNSDPPRGIPSLLPSILIHSLHCSIWILTSLNNGEKAGTFSNSACQKL